MAEHWHSDTWEPDDWDGLSFDNAVTFVSDNISNGNLTDAIAFIMRDGDVRPDSVKLALGVLADLALHRFRPAEDTARQLIRLIESWETR